MFRLTRLNYAICYFLRRAAKCVSEPLTINNIVYRLLIMQTCKEVCHNSFIGEQESCSVEFKYSRRLSDGPGPFMPAIRTSGGQKCAIYRCVYVFVSSRLRRRRASHANQSTRRARSSMQTVSRERVQKRAHPA